MRSTMPNALLRKNEFRPVSGEYPGKNGPQDFVPNKLYPMRALPKSTLRQAQLLSTASNGAKLKRRMAQVVRTANFCLIQSRSM